MTGHPLWVIPWEGDALNRKSLRPLKLRKNRYAARWVVIAQEDHRAALPRWVHPIASLRRARLGRLNLLTVPPGVTPQAKAEECLAAGEAEGILTSCPPPGAIMEYPSGLIGNCVQAQPGLRSVDCIKFPSGVQWR